MFFVRFYDTDEDEVLEVWEDNEEELFPISYHTMYKTKNGEYYVHNDGFCVLSGDVPAFEPMSFEEARSWLKMVGGDSYNREFGYYDLSEDLFDEYMERMMRDAKK